jgi:hypothetical protein
MSGADRNDRHITGTASARSNRLEVAQKKFEPEAWEHNRKPFGQERWVWVAGVDGARRSNRTGGIIIREQNRNVNRRF